MSSTVCTVNGVLGGAVSPLDRGFAYGDGVFRTFKMVQGLPESWPLHYQKLVADCAAINLVCPSAELLMEDLQQLFSVQETAVAKIIITRGEGARGYKPPAITTPTRVVVKSSMPEYAAEPVHLTVCETRLAAQPRLAGIKHLNRLENVLARMEWSDPHIADGIMLDSDGAVIECTAANIFARFGETIVTPSLHACGVAGVMRQRILQLTALKATVQSFDLEKLLSADEVVICNSVAGVRQVAQIAQTTFKIAGLQANIYAALGVS